MPTSKHFLAIILYPESLNLRNGEFEENVIQSIQRLATPIFQDDFYVFNIDIECLTLEDQLKALVHDEVAPRIGMLLGHGDKNSSSFPAWDFKNKKKINLSYEFFERKKDSYKFMFLFCCNSYDVVSNSNWDGCFTDWVGFEDKIYFNNGEDPKINMYWTRVFHGIHNSINKYKGNGKKIKQELSKIFQAISDEIYFQGNSYDYDMVSCDLIGLLADRLRCKSDVPLKKKE